MTHVPEPHAGEVQTAAKTSASGEVGAARRGGLRALLDVILCLYIAVILFRTFEVEGYIISTGSMAPSLLGFHKRVACPSCGYPFAFGISPEAGIFAGDTTEGQWRRDGGRPGDVRCPNCGQDLIDAREIPPNYGDQLLVQKNVYEFRPPRRWEVVVLKNPARPNPPFVKRIVGLPHESVQIIDGDIYANGQICRKSLDQQRAVRISVFDNDHLPNDPPQGRGDWLIEPSSHPWKIEGHGFAIQSGGNVKGHSAADRGQSAADRGQSDGDREIAWLAFHRWTRRGGHYKTEVPLSALPSDVHLARGAFAQVSYDSGRGRLISAGALAGTERDRMLATNGDAKVRAAINELYDRSHDGPITDDYGYNRAGSLTPLGVRDIMLACDVAFDSDAGEVLFEICDGQETYRLSIDRSRQEAQLTAGDHSRPLRTAACPQCAGGTFKLELSIFDRQVAAAVNGVSLFPAWECPTARAEPPRRPLRIGARGAAARIAGLKVYRDIYYTRGQGRHGVDRPIRLSADEFFVLGDNSPISNDGRSWAEGAVQISQLIGKPLVVHLPSRPGRFTLGGYTRYIRIPDFSRMRYIR